MCDMCSKQRQHDLYQILIIKVQWSINRWSYVHQVYLVVQQPEKRRWVSTPPSLCTLDVLLIPPLAWGGNFFNNL